MRTLLTLFALLLANDAAATDVLTTVRAIRPATIIAQSDLARMPSEERGALADFKDVVGFESLVTLYPGRPILPEHLGPPAIVTRNWAPNGPTPCAPPLSVLLLRQAMALSK